MGLRCVRDEELNGTYKGEVVRLLGFGAVVSFEIPQGTRSGWLHPRELSRETTNGDLKRNRECLVKVKGLAGTIPKLSAYNIQEPHFHHLAHESDSLKAMKRIQDCQDENELLTPKSRSSAPTAAPSSPERNDHENSASSVNIFASPLITMEISKCLQVFDFLPLRAACQRPSKTNAFQELLKVPRPDFMMRACRRQGVLMSVEDLEEQYGTQRHVFF